MMACRHQTLPQNPVRRGAGRIARHIRSHHRNDAHRSVFLVPPLLLVRAVLRTGIVSYLHCRGCRRGSPVTHTHGGPAEGDRDREHPEKRREGFNAKAAALRLFRPRVDSFPGRTSHEVSRATNRGLENLRARGVFFLLWLASFVSRIL